jgi:hypothetical protein
MTNSYIRLSQIRAADVFDDTLSASAIANTQSTAVDMEDVLAGQLSQMKRMIGGSNWYSNIETVAADPRSLTTITNNIYYKSILRRRQVLQSVAVPASQNWVVLSVSGSQAPSEVAAVGSSALGAVVASLAGATGAAALTAVAGLNAIQPKNQLLIRDASTFEAMLSSSREIYGLLQAASTVVDGDAFNDTTKKVQITFVRQNTAGNNLELVPSADIAGKSIEYSYVSRDQFYDLNEQDFLTGAFMDSSAISSVSLEQAYQGGNSITATTAEGDVNINLSQDNVNFNVLSGSNPVFEVIRANTGSGTVNTVKVDNGSLLVNGAGTINSGFIVDATGTAPISFGSTAGTNGMIKSTTNLLLNANGGDATLEASGVVQFKDSIQTTNLPLTDVTTGPISGLPYGPFASVGAAIKKALTSTQMNIHVQALASNHAADANVSGTVETWNPALDLSIRNTSMVSTDVLVVDTVFFLNGRMLWGGTAATKNDFYPGTTPANGDVKYSFPKGVKAGDVIIAVSWAK